MAETEEKTDADESGITMVDLLEEEEERELDAAAVLGAADDTKCTYDQGYLKRQALYACVTCCPSDSGRFAGVCLACSYHCHEDHELIELYTKRNFRCDCGNSKFPQNTCKLLKDKLPENPENSYNHNFSGAYCTCGRPYPDPEDTIDDEMIQCCVCEDWFHGRHQGGKVPPGDNYAEMICGMCLPKHQFLAHYLGLAENAGDVSDEHEERFHQDISIMDSRYKGKCSPAMPADFCWNLKRDQPETSHKLRMTVIKAEENKTEVKDESKNKKQEESVAVVDDKDKKDSQDSGFCESMGLAAGEANGSAEVTASGDVSNGTVETKTPECKLDGLVKKQSPPDGAVFLPENWRKQLCTCDKCKATYESEGVLFLLDEEDTVSFYEESGKSRHQSHNAPAQRELEALSSLDRVTRTEMVHEYNTLSSSLREYLRKFAENKKVVRDEDIREFFSQLAANKKQRPGSSIQLYCK